jgi:hypothetical protein
MNNTDIVNKARELLVRQNIISFKTDIVNMKFDKFVRFDTFQNYAKVTGMPAVTTARVPEGCTLIKGGKYLILTHHVPLPKLHHSSDGAMRRYRTATLRARWTLAHEVGHVCLGHRKDDMVEEREANLFASELLVPELVILELQRQLGRKITTSEIGRLFGVSNQAAENRLHQIESKSRFSAYLKTELMETYGRLITNYTDSEVKKCQEVL